MATIAPTKTSFVYEVEVKRVNSSVDKTISSHNEIFVDLLLHDSKGRVLPTDFCIQTFAENVGDGFSPRDDDPFWTSKKGSVRLVTGGIPTGVYRVSPVVRICEEGKDQLINPRADPGSVAVPASNSVTVEIK